MSLPFSEYIMRIAQTVAERSTCPRASVGAVITQGGRIIATGYNGAPSGIKHCEDHGCIVYDEHCVTAVHAELNAILQAARSGVSTENATLWVTHLPCLYCTKAIINVGIKNVYYGIAYRPDKLALRFFEDAKVQVIQLVFPERN